MSRNHTPLFNLVIRANPQAPMRDDRMLEGTPANIRGAVCEGDPFRLLAKHTDQHKRRLVPANPTQAAVMMPFDCEAELDPIYQAIVAGANTAGYRCVRVDELSTPTVITDDIVKLIRESGVIVADISGVNANVMYELGYARALDKKVIVVSADSLSSLPFDIRQWRTFKYVKTTAGLKELSHQIAKALDSLA